MSYNLVRDGDVVGTVTFDPFDFEYNADPENAAVRDALEATLVMTSPDTAAPEGVPDDEPALAAERFDPAPADARESALRRALASTDHELVDEDDAPDDEVAQKMWDDLVDLARDKLS